jgi:hypothetical protein
VIAAPALVLSTFVAWRIGKTIELLEEVAQRWTGQVDLEGRNGNVRLGLSVGGTAGEVALGDGHRNGAVFRAFALAVDPKACLATLVHSGATGNLVVATYTVGDEVPTPFETGPVFRVVRIRNKWAASSCTWESPYREDEATPRSQPDRQGELPSGEEREGRVAAFDKQARCE